MPRIDDKAIIAKKPFKKKAYRPWNLMDNEFKDEVKIDVEIEKLSPIKELVTNEEPIDNHLVTNHKSISNQIVTNPVSIETKQESISNLISNPISNHGHSQLAEKKIAACINTDVSHTILRLYGIQRKLLFHIIEDCILNSSLSTSPISTEMQVIIANT